MAAGSCFCPCWPGRGRQVVICALVGWGGGRQVVISALVGCGGRRQVVISALLGWRGAAGSYFSPCWLGRGAAGGYFFPCWLGRGAAGRNGIGERGREPIPTLPRPASENYEMSFKSGQGNFLLAYKSNMRKFLCSFCYRKSANFLDVPVRKTQIRTFLYDKSVNTNPQILS